MMGAKDSIHGKMTHIDAGPNHTAADILITGCILDLILLSRMEYIAISSS